MNLTYNNEVIIDELENLINYIVEDVNLKSSMIGFLQKHKLQFNRSSVKLSNEQHYNIGIFINFISAISLTKKIDNLDWNFFCYIFNNYNLCMDLIINSNYLYNFKNLKYSFEILSRNCKTVNNFGIRKWVHLLTDYYKYIYDLT